MVISEITEEKDEDSDDGCSCSMDSEAQKARIRQIIQYQKSLYLASSSSSSSSSSSAASTSCSFSSSSRGRNLMQLMRGGNTSLRRLFDMEHTSLGDYFEEYSGSPIIKPVFLWGSSDTEPEEDRDPWTIVRHTVGNMKQHGGSRSGLASERSRSFKDDGEVTEFPIRSRRASRKLTRKRSFRKLPGFGKRRWRGFRFRFRFRLRRPRIMICGRKY